MATVNTLRLWDDNPSLIDLLGFDAVVAPIIAAIGTRGVDPLDVAGPYEVFSNMASEVKDRCAVTLHVLG